MDRSHLTDEEIGWLCGLFEGEGSILHYQTPVKGTSRMTTTRGVAVGMTDEDVLRRFHRLVGCGTVYGWDSSNKKHKKVWMWRCSKWVDLKPLLELLEPRMGVRRKDKIRLLLLDPPKNTPTNTHCNKGHEWTPENTYVDARGWRNCRACARDSARRMRARAARNQS